MVNCWQAELCTRSLLAAETGEGSFGYNTAETESQGREPEASGTSIAALGHRHHKHTKAFSAWPYAERASGPTSTRR